MKVLVTSRLIVRPYSKADVSQLAAILSDAEVMRYVFAGLPLIETQLTEFIDRNFARTETDQFGLGTVLETNEDTDPVIIGCAGITSCSILDDDDYEFGFALGAFAWGRQIGSEIARELIRYGLRELDLRRLLATVHPGNSRSVRVLQRIGMHCVGEKEVLGRGKRQVWMISRC